jgi:hypothetical protein
VGGGAGPPSPPRDGAPRRGQRLLLGGRHAGRLEDVVGAAPAGERAHLLHRVAVGGVDEVGRAELAGHLAPPGDRLDGDDLRRPGEARALDHP